MTEPPWLGRVRAEHPDFDGLPLYMKQYLAHEDGAAHPGNRLLTREEAEMRSSLDPDMLTCHMDWWTTGKEEADLSDFGRYQKMVDEAVASSGPIAARIYCRDCSATKRGNRMQHPLGWLKRTQFGLLFEAKRPYGQAVEVLRAEGMPDRLANRAYTLSYLLIDQPDPGHRPAVVHCTHHGDAWVPLDELRRSAKTADRKLVVECTNA